VIDTGSIHGGRSVVCAWLGNTPKIAMKHYLQVTEEDYKKAAGDEPGRQAG
jgi:cephalosporin hydroxylase